MTVIVRLSRIAVAAVCLTGALAGCAGVRFDKAGEADAKSACEQLHGIQEGGDALSLGDGMMLIASAEQLANSAARANDDYQPLAEGMAAFADSLMSGTESMAGIAWANLAQQCNDM